ncbi:hypothetical protein J4408_03635 [Candidatus Pacearchaeota archaeon]|nr:hypothetical protein [Candidatus Pacearchaeota archaeon]
MSKTFFLYLSPNNDENGVWTGANKDINRLVVKELELSALKFLPISAHDVVQTPMLDVFGNSLAGYREIAAFASQRPNTQLAETSPKYYKEVVAERDKLRRKLGYDKSSRVAV